MNLEDLKDQLQEQWAALKDRVEENPTFNTLREKYETLSPNVQKAILIGAASFGILILLSIPYSYLSSANSYVSDYEENKHLIRELLKAGSAPTAAVALPEKVNASQLQSRYRAVLQSAQLAEGQIGNITPLSTEDESKLARPPINQAGIAIHLNQLNLRQIIEVGYRIQTADNNVKMTGLEVIANAENDHYFDVIYKLMSFYLPPADENRKPLGRGERQ